MPAQKKQDILLLFKVILDEMQPYLPSKSSKGTTGLVYFYCTFTSEAVYSANMNKAVLHKCVLAALVACIAAQSVLIAKPTDVSSQKSDPRLQMTTFSETTTLFLSLQNRPKTGSVFSAMDGYPTVGLGRQGLWNIFHSNAFKTNGCFNSLCQAAAPVSLYALSCQFTI